MKKCFYEFDHRATWQWFEQHRIKLYAQDDERVFPVSDRAAEVAGMFMDKSYRMGITIRTSCRLERIEPADNGYRLHFTAMKTPVQADAVIVATGGLSSQTTENAFMGIPLKIEPPVPSLFAFTVRDNSLRSLSGLGCPKAIMRLPGTKYCAQGDLLITHFGLSGPATLKLSSYAARYLSEQKYRSRLSVNWTGLKEDRIRAIMQQELSDNSSKQLGSIKIVGLSNRLWLHLLQRSGSDSKMPCAAIGKKQQNKLINTLANDEYLIDGKAANKDEFVTCGGVSLSAIHSRSMECTDHPHLYFIGEALDVDAVTGGFNLQAAWSTAFVATRHLATSFCRQE